MSAGDVLFRPGRPLTGKGAPAPGLGQPRRRGARGRRGALPDRRSDDTPFPSYPVTRNLSNISPTIPFGIQTVPSTPPTDRGGRGGWGRPCRPCGQGGSHPLDGGVTVSHEACDWVETGFVSRAEESRQQC